jgi:endonuclease YncB( thermonuclease family)
MARSTATLVAATALTLAVANDIGGDGILTRHVAALLWPAPIVASDGDTVRQGGERYRLIGFDAPEVRAAKCDEERVLGRVAGVRLQLMIWTARTAKLAPTAKRDRYGRVLAHLLIDGRDAGDVLIERGLARRYDGGHRQPWC